MTNRVTILGYFPPPVTGQAVATERLAQMLRPHVPVETIDMSYKAPVVRTREGWSAARIRHYLTLRRQIAHRLARHSGPVIWPAISSNVPGHLRDLLTIYPALRLKRPVLAVVHRGNIPQLFRQSLTARSARWLTNQLTGMVVLANTLATPLRSFVPPEKLFVIPNTVTQDWLLELSELENRLSRHPGKPFRVLFLSNMLPEKGLWDALEAVIWLHNQGLPIEIYMVGGWTDRIPPRTFQKWIIEHHAETYAVHHGQITDPLQLREHFMVADALVLPTYYPLEAQPQVLIEAMALGTPIITTQQGGIPDMLNTSEALFVPPRDPRAIAEALMALMEPNVWRTRARAVFHRFQQQFHPRVVQKRWLELLRPLLPEQIMPAE